MVKKVIVQVKQGEGGGPFQSNKAKNVIFQVKQGEGDVPIQTM